MFKLKQTAVALMAVPIVLSGTVYAQTGTENRDESEIQDLGSVVVYSRGIRESRFDTPFMMDVMDGSTLKQRAATTTLDALKLVPSVSVSDTGNPQQSLVWVRGVGSLSGTGMEDHTVDVVIDGVSNGLAGISRPLFDVERVEVAKGPQGVLYGHRSSAGNLLLKTVDPHNEFEASIGGSLGNRKLRGVNAILNVPLSDQVAFRLAAQRERRDDFIRDAETGKRVSIKDTEYVSGKLRWFDGDRNDLILHAWYDRRKNNHPIIMADPLSHHTLIRGLPMGTWRKNAGVSLTYKHHFDFGTLESITAYQRHSSWIQRHVRGYDMLEPMFAGLPPAERRIMDNYYGNIENNKQVVSEKVNQLSQELKLSGETSAGLKWITGVYLERRDRDFSWDATRGIQGKLGLDNYNGDFVRIFDRDTAALYGEVTVPVTERLNVVAGLRYSHERLDHEETFYPHPANTLSSHASFSHKLTDNLVSGRLGLNYALTPTWRLYALQSIGHKSGSFADWNTNISREGGAKPAEPYDASHIYTTEIGSKFLTADGRFALDVAMFYNKVSDEHVTIVEPNWVSYSDNADTESYGAELTMIAQVTDNWRLQGDLVWLHTEVTDVPESAQNITSKGNRLAQAARWSGGALVAYESDQKNLAFLGAGKFNGHVGMRFIGSRYSQVRNTQKLPSIVLFDASVGLQTKHHDFYVWGKNLLDKRYMGFGAGIANMGVPAEGRTFGVNYSYKF
ncbi:TonB-dependent receptor Fiu [Oligella urethralis]|uniref:TonB-dependent receptor n=1 Tax=Oligella urethralis TaxID=90245 RepID=UPI000E03B8DD|nr:TonB-dependent receptor [Oligella urethralis]SUA53158.1 TonB-dependent receptor Fiu [Oligella urethralis]